MMQGVVYVVDAGIASKSGYLEGAVLAVVVI